MAPGSMPPVEPVAHHQVGAVAQLAEEAAEVVEGVAVVGVGHEHVLAARPP